MTVQLNAGNFNRHRNAYKAMYCISSFLVTRNRFAYRLDIATKESFECPKHIYTLAKLCVSSLSLSCYIFKVYMSCNENIMYTRTYVYVRTYVHWIKMLVTA